MSDRDEPDAAAGRPGLLAELRRRNVIRMAGLYLVGAWLVVQIAETLLPIFHTPDWVLQALVVLLALGFIPALVFSWVFELTPDGLKRDADVPAGQSIATQTARRMDRLILAGMLALAVLIVGERMWPRSAPEAAKAAAIDPAAGAGAANTQDPPAGAASAGTASATGTAPANSIAVLPFVNMSGDADNEYFSDGISEEILNVLAGAGELQVAARTSSFSFKGKDIEIPEIARALNVRLVLEGSVRKQGERVRITAQLIDAQNGFHVWSQTYDRDLQDIFAIQDEIAQAIGAELKVKVGGGAGGSIPGSGTSDLAAYDLYLRGMQRWHLRREDDLWEAIELFEQAAAADPAFAQAWAGQALVYSVMPAYTDRLSYAQADPLVLDRALIALALDPLQPEPYAALAMPFGTSDATWEALLERAIALRPSFATAHQWFGTRLMARGRLAEGLASMERASALDPRSAVIANNHAYVLLTAGRTADARRRCEQSLAITPDDISCLQYAGIASLLLGDLDDARAKLRKLAKISVGNAGDQPDRIIDALSGKGDRTAVARELAALPFNSVVIPDSGNAMEDQIVALVLVLLGEHGLALDYVERISGELGNTMDWGVMLPALDPIRCEPRFQAVVTKFGATDPYAATVCAEK